jgi:7-cyano-7-deazaguanine synthase
MRSSVCVLISGGADSAALAKLAAKRFREVRPLYVAFGLAWETAELHWLRRLLRAMRAPGLRPLTVLRLDARELYGPHWSLTGARVPGYRSADERVYLPGRNVLLLSQAGVFCARRKIPRVWIGTLKGNPFSDSRPAFFRAMEKVLARGLGAAVRIEAPFRRLGKVAALKRAGPIPLELTFSCLAPRGVRPCGRCNKCAERDRAFSALRRAWDGRSKFAMIRA